MSWVQRGRRRVYYHAVRRGKAVRRVYLGDGPAATAVADQIEQRKQAREAQRQELAEREAQYRAGTGPLATLEALLDGLVGASLLMSGHHRHDRGEWRRSCFGTDDEDIVSRENRPDTC